MFSCPPIFYYNLFFHDSSLGEHQQALFYKDEFSDPNRWVGLGIFVCFAGFQPSKSIYIRARRRVNSVLMAELAALVLAAKVAETLELRNATFYTDCRDLVLQLQKGEAQAFWSLRPLISQFLCLQDRFLFKVGKINRQENEIAHCLAMQAKAMSNHTLPSFSCHFLNHGIACDAITALQDVTWGPVDLIDVICF